MDSVSAMSRMKTITGLKMSNTSGGSSYIMVSKLKRAIKAEVTDDVFNEVKSRYFVTETNVRREIFADKMINKLEQFTNDMVEYCFNHYSEYGIVELCHLLKSPIINIRKGASKIKAKRNREEGKSILTLKRLPTKLITEFNFSNIYI